MQVTCHPRLGGALVEGGGHRVFYPYYIMLNFSLPAPPRGKPSGASPVHRQALAGSQRSPL